MSDGQPFMDENEIQAVACCLTLFDRPVKVLEWGSGESTRYFSRLLGPGSSWLAVEHQYGWFRHVQASISGLGGCSVAVVHVPPGREYVEGEDDGDVATFSAYIQAPQRFHESYEFILVDGRARVACLAKGWEMLDPQGFMVLHDAQRPEYARGIPCDGYLLRITNPKRSLENRNIETLFMAKSRERITALARKLSTVLSSFIAIEMSAPQQPIDGGLVRNHRRSCIFLNTYYPAFLDDFYRSKPDVAALLYSEQLAALYKTLFGDSDFYSHGLRGAGWDAADLILNSAPLQQAWARENGFQGSLEETAIEQIRQAEPDVVYLQDMHSASRDFIAAIRPHTRLIVGQIASLVNPQTPFDHYDMIFSSFPHYVDMFRRYGMTAYYQPLAFDPRITAVIPALPYGLRPVDCSFVGGISPLHAGANELFDHLARHVPIRFWGYGVHSLPEDSPVREKHQGEAWGKEMLYLLAASRVTINRHVDAAEQYANNMRLFEATGSGALLITDYKYNLGDLFDIGEEVVAYRSPDECAALVAYYLAHPGDAARIARAGQARTLKEHSYQARMAQTAEILERHLNYRAERGCFSAVDLSMMNTGHAVIDPAEITPAMTHAWQHGDIPVQQRALVQRQLEEMYTGSPAAPFRILAQALKAILSPGDSILEVGCASGYYYEILEYLLNARFRYLGVDYSEPMIAMAYQYYPKTPFIVADGASLPFPRDSFDCVITSSVLLHVPNFREHVAEAVRVAREYVVAHRTPVSRQRSTHYLKKQAYGVETVELLFNEEQILAEFQELGLQLVDAFEVNSSPENDCYEMTYLFVRQPNRVHGESIGRMQVLN